MAIAIISERIGVPVAALAELFERTGHSLDTINTSRKGLHSNKLPEHDIPTLSFQQGIMSSNSHNLETVLIVHGTFSGRPEDGAHQDKGSEKAPKWYEPDEEFCRKLDEELAKRGSSARCWQHLEGARHFYWDGANNWLSRARAALRLRREIKRLNEEGWVVHLVGHSHGGNVIIDAITQNRGGTFPWFNARVVLLGTPIYADSWDYNKKKRRLFQSWLIFSVLLWAALLLISTKRVDLGAALADGTWTQNYAITAIMFGFIAGVSFLIPAWRYITSKTWTGLLWSIRMGITEPFTPKEMRNSPSFMMINSRFDEAFKGLSAIKEARNPFLQESDEGNASLSEILMPVRKSILTVIQSTLDTKVVWPHFVAGVVLILIAAFWKQIALALSSGSLSEIGLSLTLLLLLSALLILGAMFRRFFGRVLLAPGAMIYSALHFVAGTVKGVTFYLFDGLLRRMVWGFVKTFALGVGGGPRGAADINVSKKFDDVLTEDYIYLELPDTIIEDIKSKQRQRLTDFHQMLYRADLKWTPMALREELEGIGFPLVHTAYYEQDSCIEKIADWICEPLEELMDFTHTVETVDVVSVRDGVTCKTQGTTELPNEYRLHFKRLERKYYEENPDWVMRILPPRLRKGDRASRMPMMPPPARRN